MSLTKQTISGVFWTFIDTFFIKGLTFCAMLLLARWLGPEEFGLLGMISVFLAIGITLVDSGLSSSIIRTNNADDEDFSTVFYMNLAMSIFIYLILFFVAPYIALFYDQEILTNVIRVYCLIFVISAFSAIHLAILNKEMKFKRLMILNIPATIMGVLVGLFLGYEGYGVWSIIFLFLTTQIVLSALLWMTSKWIPSLRFSKIKLLYHYKFGYKLMLSGLINQIFDYSYNILIGKYFPIQILGFYERSKRLNEYPAMTIAGIVGKVTYPMLSNLQSDKVKLSIVCKKILKLTFFITAPLMLGLAAIANPLFKIILGENWLTAVPFFQILSLSSILYPIHAININILKVFGRSDLFLKLEIIKKIVVVFSIIIGFQFGILGLVWSIVFTSFTALIINTHYSGKLIGYFTKRQLIDMLPALLISIVTFVIMHYSLIYLSDHNNFIQILIPIIIGFCSYILLSYFFNNRILNYMFLIIKTVKI